MTRNTIRVYGINPCLGKPGLPVIRSAGDWYSLNYKTGETVSLPFDVNPNFLYGFGTSFLYINGISSAVYDEAGNLARTIPAPYPWGWSNTDAQWCDKDTVRQLVHHTTSGVLSYYTATWSAAGTVINMQLDGHSLPNYVGGMSHDVPNPRGGQGSSDWYNPAGQYYGRTAPVPGKTMGPDLGPHHSGLFAHYSNDYLYRITYPTPTAHSFEDTIVTTPQQLMHLDAPWRILGADKNGCIVLCADGIARNINELGHITTGANLAALSSPTSQTFAVCYSHLW